MFQMCFVGMCNPTLSQKQIPRYLDSPDGKKQRLNFFRNYAFTFEILQQVALNRNETVCSMADACDKCVPGVAMNS
jgi:hypothetical protein